MRKALLFFVAIALLCALTLGVSADQIDHSGFYATVLEDGSCQVSMTITISMERMDTSMRFPIPAKASDVQLNGFGVGTYYSGTVQYVNLSSVLGAEDTTATFTLSYKVSDVVDGTGKLHLPLLSGFQLPIDSFDFTVSFPGTVSNQPSFTSTYHQSNIESSMYWTVTGSTVSGRINTLLNDYETLDMTLKLDSSQFSRNQAVFIDSAVDDRLMRLCVILALAYWVVFMRMGLPRFRRCSQPPQGYTAGHIRPILTLQGADLSLMVLSWAQMGYVLLERKGGGKILVHRQMDMGNERPAYEQQIFSLLFKKKDTVDTGSLAYAVLCGKVEKQNNVSRIFAHKRNGNPLIFRLISLLVSLFAGVNVGLALGSNASWQIVLLILFGILGLVLGNAIQNSAQGIFLYKPGILTKGLLAAALWMLPFFFCGKLKLGLNTVLYQLIAGILAVYGGRRSPDGADSLSQTLGLLLSFLVPEKASFSIAKKADPEYFHAVAPYALSFGADRLFAYRFGKERIPECPYILGIPEADRTATQWSRILRNTLRSMNARYEGLKKERLINSIYNLRK